MHLIMQHEIGSYSYAGIGYANPHAVTSIGGTTYTYDNNGNVTAIGSLDYTWDWRNRLSSAERSAGGVTTYGYDHTGQRVFQATGNATTSYPNRYYNVASSSVMATTTKHIFSPDGTPLATVVSSGVNATTTYLHPDHLGGTNVATDENGDVVQTLDYYPYGSQRIATGSFDEQRRFIGEEFDGDTEFSYLNARYYEGSRGQFLSQDPVFLLVGDPARMKQMTQKEMLEFLGDPQVLNSYSYARNNPLVLVDKSGEAAFLPLFLMAYSAFSLGYSAGEVLNSQFLFRGSYTDQERSSAFFNLGFNVAAEGAAYGLADDVKDAYLTLGPDVISVFERLSGADEQRKRRGEQGQTRDQASVTVKGPSIGSGSGSGGTYAYPAPSRNPVGSGRSSGGNLSGSQQSALQSFSSAINAQSFDAQAFVSSLQAIIKAFELK